MFKYLLSNTAYDSFLFGLLDLRLCSLVQYLLVQSRLVQSCLVQNFDVAWFDGGLVQSSGLEQRSIPCSKYYPEELAELGCMRSCR